MAQFFQIEGTQQVFVLQRDDGIGLQFATQESCVVNQTNTTVLQHPQGVLLAEGVVGSSNNSTIEVRYANPNPPALYYHTTPHTVEQHQNEVVVNAHGAQQARIIQQLQPLQNTHTLIGNQVVHNHITNETYEVAVETEAVGEQLEGEEEGIEAEAGEEDQSQETNISQSVISSTSDIVQDLGKQQDGIPSANNQAAQQTVQPQTVFNHVVQQQIVQSVVPQQCVVQQIPVVPQTVSVQHHHLVSTDNVQVNSTGNSTVTQSFIIGTPGSPQTVQSVLYHQPISTEKVLQVKQQPQLKQYPQVLQQQAKPQAQVIQQVTQQHQVIKQIRQQPQGIKQMKVKQQVRPQLQGSQKIQVSKDCTVQTFPQTGIRVTTITPAGRGNVQSYSNNDTVKKKRTPNITRRSSSGAVGKVNQIQQSDQSHQAQVQTTHVLEVASTESIDLPQSKSDEIMCLVQAESESDKAAQKQVVHSVSRTFLTGKSRVGSQKQQAGEVQVQSPQLSVQGSPHSLPNPVVMRLEPPNSPQSLTSAVKQIVVHHTPGKQIATYPSAKPRVFTKTVPTEVTSPATPQQHQAVVHREPPVEKPTSATISLKQNDRIFFVPSSRPILQASSAIRGGNKVILNLEDIQRAVIEGTITLKPKAQGFVLASGGHVLKSENALLSGEGLRKLGVLEPKVPADAKKIIPGKLALCPFCGQSSEDFNRCLRCKRKLPDHCKVVVDPVNASNENSEVLKKDCLVDPEKLCSGSAPKVVSIAVNAIEAKRRTRAPVRKTKIVPDVPECLTLSSDEEDHVDHDDDDIENSLADIDEEGMDGHKNTDEQYCSSGIEGGGLLEKASDGSLAPPHCLLVCRSVRIGSYKVKPLQRVVLAKPGIEVVVPNPSNEAGGVKLFIAMQDIRRVLLCSDRSMPVLFILVKTTVATRVRELLNMTDPSSNLYFNPDSKDEVQKRITLLPEKWNDDSKMTIQMIVPKTILLEIPYSKANEILLRSCPKETQAQIRKANAASKIQTIMVYPPPPAKAGISINTEDYACLGEDVFLNDVIIDFYLKYLMLAVLSPEDRERTHVFSTFFYKRLTSPPAKSMRASHPVESDPKLSAAEKRHSRVKSWTKNINLFTKDFIIIPINEKCHWFLAIICFPGQDGCVRMIDNAPVSPTVLTSNATQSAAAAAAAAAATAAAVAAASGSSKIKLNSNNVLSIGSTTITPVKAASDTITLDCSNGDEGSDRDEAEGDEDEMDEPTSEEDEESAPSTAENNVSVIENCVKTEIPEAIPARPKNGRGKPVRDGIKQPCILIFDSLMGAPRSRVVATLRDYLRIEHKVKQGREKDFNKDTIKGMMPKVPQQKNFTDCGLYLLQYVEQFFKDPIKDYHSPIKFLKDWFPAEVVRRKRQEIQQLLHKLMEDQKIDVTKLNLPRLTFSSSKVEEEGEAAEAGLCEGAVEVGVDALAAQAAAQAAMDAARAAAEAAQAAAVEEEAAAHEVVWGAAGAEEEVTTDGVDEAVEYAEEYEPMETEEFVEDEMVGHEEEVEGEEEVPLEEEECGDEEVCGPEEVEENHFVESGVVRKMPGPRLVSYDDSSEDGWSTKSPPGSPALIPVTQSSEALKRTHPVVVRRASDIKRMRCTSDR